MLFFHLLAFNLTKKHNKRKKSYSNRKFRAEICLKWYCSLRVCMCVCSRSRKASPIYFTCKINYKDLVYRNPNRVRIEWSEWHTISLFSKLTKVINIEDLKHLISGHLFKLKLQINNCVCMVYSSGAYKELSCSVWPFVMQMVI